MKKIRTFGDGIATTMMLMMGLGIVYMMSQEWASIIKGLGYAVSLIIWGAITYVAQYPTKEVEE